MNKQTPQNAVSPVVGVILVVAVTVLLSAVVGAFVFNLGQSTQTPNQSVGVKSVTDGGNVTVTVITGTADELQLRVNGTTVDSKLSATPGDVLTGPANSDSTVAVISVLDGESTLVSNTNPFSTRGSNANSISTATPVSGPSAPTTGLIAHWKLDSGPLDSVGVYDLTESGSPTLVASPRNGGYDLDGVDDHLTNTSWTTPYPSSFTASAWVKFDSVGDGDTDRVFAADDSNNGWWLSEGDPGGKQLRFGIRESGGGWAGADTTAILTNGTWYHLTVTYNASSGDMVLYSNGSVEATALTTSPRSYGGGFHIGYDAGEGNYFDGIIDDARMYNRALNSSEVSDLYNATK